MPISIVLISVRRYRVIFISIFCLTLVCHSILYASCTLDANIVKYTYVIHHESYYDDVKRLLRIIHVMSMPEAIYS